MGFLGFFYWNPSREAFVLPLVNHPIAWYGILFVFGLVVGYALMFRLLSRHFVMEEGFWGGEAKKRTAFLIDRLCWLLVVGTIVGARLGHILVYDWPYYRENFWRIFETWKGGLASHGAGVGILCALFLFQRWVRSRHDSLRFLVLLDMLVIPTAFAGFCIRIGNFFNQELIGTVTQMPWAVVFGMPADGSLPLPRHAVQLYEACTYLVIFALLLPLWWKTSLRERRGFISGLFFVLVFIARIFWEFFKETVVTPWSIPRIFQAGQWLSIPYVLMGVALLWYAMRQSVARVKSASSL